MKKILFYTANGVGLGHLRRTSLIAESIKQIDAKTDIFFLTMSPKVSFLNELKISCVKLKHLTDDLVKNHMDFEKAKKFNEKKFLNVVKKYNPEIIVLDVYLFGFSFPEIILSPYFKNIIKVLILRKKQEKEFSKVLNQAKAILNNFQKIILPHAKTELKQTSILNDSRFVISGPVFKKLETAKLEACRRKYKVSPKDFLITLSLGGGGELKSGECDSPEKIIKNFLSIYPRLLKSIPDLKTVVSSGPYFINFRRKTFPNLRFVRFEKSFPELIKLSDLVISTAGYNTCNELINAQIPAILIPLFRGDKEQFERASYLEKKGVVRVLKDGSSDKLLELIINVKDNLDKMRLNFKKFSDWQQGNNKVAKEILNLLK